MKKFSIFLTLGMLLTGTEALSAECYLCSYVGGQTSCAPTQPRTGYHVCTVMGPGWCEVSQPCNPYGPPKALVTVAQFLPRQLVFGATQRGESAACVYSYLATKRPAPANPPRTAAG